MSTKWNWVYAVPPKRRPPQGSAAAKHAPAGYAGFALAPAVARRRSRWVFRKKTEIQMPRLGPDRHKSALRHRDALRHIDEVERDTS
jgi:hypothetical protein